MTACDTETNMNQVNYVGETENKIVCSRRILTFIAPFMSNEEKLTIA